ncbi:MAG: hypothetical protein IJI14_10490 [Anaerolineaceae bacterium]|nr:hypothetical protein [Anaerolineaceae bacterium]
MKNSEKYINPVGGYAISNVGGVVIYEVNDEYAVAGLSCGGEVKNIRKHKVYWDYIDETGETSPYFNKNGVRILLSECIRFQN